MNRTSNRTFRDSSWGMVMIIKAFGVLSGGVLSGGVLSGAMRQKKTWLCVTVALTNTCVAKDEWYSTARSAVRQKLCMGKS